MLRTILVVFTFVIFVIVTLPIQLFTLICDLTPYKEKVRARSFRVAQWWFGLLSLESGAKIKVTGLERIPKDRAVLFAGNHNSYFDIILTFPIMPAFTGYISKKDLMYIPLLNLWMYITHCLFLDRKDIKAGLKMINDAAENIRLGVSMFIFPEGTRNKSGDERNMAPMKDGSFKIAEKTLCPIVPVAITGTADVYEAHAPFIKASDVTIEFGEPIYPDQLEPKKRKHMGGMVTERVMNMLVKAKEEA